MSQQVLGKNVENLNSNVETSNMSKAEADKTIVKGIAHKYEGAVKHALGGITGKPSLKETGEETRNEAIEQIQVAKAVRKNSLGQDQKPENPRQNTLQDSEEQGIPDAEYVIQHERDEHPNNPVNEYQTRNPPNKEARADASQEKEGQRDQHLHKQLNKRENPEADPSILRTQRSQANDQNNSS
ncbi:hypothetical protein INT43_006981 [Umbelopsis isabellina]|uniref:CsbD-like domain-containing protein n=1 Tax=Mortierella isabellina TaxID=91625 RepID=A0A8H7PYH2_MORIS|nr:hypothetical protein INT43_006981 [Umbelopsis isabellina]